MLSNRAAEFIATKYGADRSGNSSYENEKLMTSDKLEVTVIPVDEEPYSKMITIPPSMIGKCTSHCLLLNSFVENITKHSKINI